MWICDKRLYRSADGRKVVLEGDVRARTLIAAPGDELPEKPAIEKLDTGQPGKKTGFSSQKDDSVKQKSLELTEDKAIKPDENKGRTKTPPPPPPDDPAKRAASLDLEQDEDQEDEEY